MRLPSFHPMTPADLQALLGEVESNHGNGFGSLHIGPLHPKTVCLECGELWPCPPIRLASAVREMEKDAKRGRYMIEHGEWRRDSVERRTHLCVLVPYGSNLGSPGSREDAIDSALSSSTGANND